MIGNTYFMSMIGSRCCNKVFRSNRVNIGNRNSSKFNFAISLVGLGAVCGFGFALTKKYPAIRNASSSLYQNFLRYLFPARPPSYGEALVSAETELPIATLEEPREDLRTPLEKALSEWVEKGSSLEEKAIRLGNQKAISAAYQSNILSLKGDLTQLPSILWQEPFIERLESLKLLDCNLVSIPEEIALAKNLKFFKIEGSKLFEFPACLISQLDKLVLFQVENNLDVDKVDFYKDRSILENPRRGNSLSVTWNQQNAAYLYTECGRVAIHA